MSNTYTFKFPKSIKARIRFDPEKPGCWGNGIKYVVAERDGRLYRLFYDPKISENE